MATKGASVQTGSPALSALVAKIALPFFSPAKPHATGGFCS